MTALPTGTVTFLFTDLEGSTRLWEEHPDAMHDALARHDEILRDAIAAHDGHVVKTTGDGFHAAFADASSRGAGGGRRTGRAGARDVGRHGGATRAHRHPHRARAAARRRLLRHRRSTAPHA